LEKADKVKQLFRGVFDLNCTVRTMYAYAYTERQAWATMCRRIAKADGVSIGAVMALFDGSRENYRINIETEMKELAE